VYVPQIEGLLEDVDFSSKVTREELETMCADLFDRVGEPVNQALRSADMTMVIVYNIYVVSYTMKLVHLLTLNTWP